MSIRLLITGFILYILIPSPVFGIDSLSTGLAFPDQLCIEKEYQLAEIEYQRLLFSEAHAYPDSLILIQRIARTKYLAKRHDEVREYCEQKLFTEGIESDQLYLISGLAYYRMGYYPSALIQFARIMDPELRHFVQTATLLKAQMIAEAQELLSQTQKDFADHILWKQLDLIQQDAHHLKLKSTRMATLATAVIPGSGYAYLGYYQTGLNALILNALILGTAFELNSNGLNVSSGIVYLLGFGWYVGTISGTYQKAVEVNEMLYEAKVGNLSDQVIQDLESMYLYEGLMLK